MKNWIDRMSRMVGGLLFQGGYVTSPATLGGGRPSPATGSTADKCGVRANPCTGAVAAGA